MHASIGTRHHQPQFLRELLEQAHEQLMNLYRPQSRNSIANDEAIAQTLQEELTKLDSEEAGLGEHSKAAVLSQDWETFPDEDEAIFAVNTDWADPKSQPSSSSSAAAVGETKMGSRKQASSASSDAKAKAEAKARAKDFDAYQYGDDEENLTLALALSEDEDRYDEEVARRLSELDSIRHVPRINAEELPASDIVSQDHARLIERLYMYGLNERKIQGDGNCQFRALSDQLYRTPEHHEFVRKTIVERLKEKADLYSGYVPMAYSEYLTKMAKSGEWGDHVTLQAAADSYGVKIWLITSFKNSEFVEILPTKLMSNRVIYLSFWAEVHYNSICSD